LGITSGIVVDEEGAGESGPVLKYLWGLSKDDRASGRVERERSLGILKRFKIIRFFIFA
jgi:hypothetical protein